MTGLKFAGTTFTGTGVQAVTGCMACSRYGAMRGSCIALRDLPNMWVNNIMLQKPQTGGATGNVAFSKTNALMT